MNGTAAVNAKRAGLFATGTEKRAPVPLEGVKVHAEVAGHASRVTLLQRYRNTETVPIEAAYVFPLPEAAAVCGLTMRVGDRVIEGEVEDREKAFDRYDEALAEGHGAALLDVERPNVFTMSVGNILPGQEITIELRFVAELPLEADAIRFLLPATVAPRYAPDEDRHGVSPTAAERVSPPVDLEVPYGLELEVDVTLPCPVRAVDSPSHPVRVEIDGSRARVTLSHGTAAMDRDFVLLVTPQEAGRPHALVERNDDGLATAAVLFAPRFERAAAPKEVVFLVDRSGSMAGDSMNEVRAALQLCLRSLRDGDTFNIVGFGSTFASLFPSSRPYDQSSLEAAGEHVKGLQADMGGTEILPALRSVLEGGTRGGLAREIVLLTDGEVSNEAAVIELAEAHRDDTRIFTFGIGSGASEYLVRSLARVTRGEAEFIHPGERIEAKVLRQFGRLGAPVLRDVKVEWAGAAVTLQAPGRPPAIFDGEAGVLYARIGAATAATVTLSADLEGKRVSWSVPVDAAAAAPGNLLATLAARAAIRDLEEGTSALHDTLRGSAQRGRREARVKQEIVALATRYCLASRETSLVAVERLEGTADQPTAELRRVPVALTHGWGGVVADSGVRYSVRAAALFGDNDVAMLCALPAQSAPIGRARGASPASPSQRLRQVEPMMVEFPERPSAARNWIDEHGEPLAPEGRRHLAVAVLQRADGAWMLDPALAAALGVDIADLEAIAASLGGSRKAAQSIVATLAALRFLDARAAEARDEWRMLAEKAERWLAKALASRPADVRGRLEASLAVLLS